MKCPPTWSKIGNTAASRRCLLTDNRWCKFAANNAVDILSLVLSADPNKRSESSFSYTFRTEGLEKGIPFGSFGVSKENHEQHVRKPDEIQSLLEYEQRQELVSKGARMEALDTATDEILKAAKKLEREVRRETKYWQEIVSISDKGWPIQRVRQNARNVPFAVRYGLPEGGSLRDCDSMSSKLTLVQLVIISKPVDSLLCA
jgi:mediator of RNA polymerase II transcription subunit 17